MTESPIKTIQDGHVLEVILDRPKANAIDLKTSRIMGDVFASFRDNPEPVSYTHLTLPTNREV